MSAGLSPLDRRVLMATDPGWHRHPEQIAEDAGVATDVALSTLRRLRSRYLVESNNRRRPATWIRTPRGDAALSEASRFGRE